MIDLPDPKLGCHRTGFTKKCRDLLVDGTCNRWMQIQGPNPQTGETINRSDCIDNWLPMLTIENSQQQRQTAASVDKVATEINKFHENMIKMNEMTLRQLSSRVSHTAVMEHNTYGPFDKQ